MRERAAGTLRTGFSLERTARGRGLFTGRVQACQVEQEDEISSLTLQISDSSFK